MALPLTGPPDGFVTTGQAAERIGSTPQHVRHLIRTGRLPAIDIARGGGRPRFRISEVDFAEFLRSAAVTPTQEVA